jgi:hypothetical protein
MHSPLVDGPICLRRPQYSVVGGRGMDDIRPFESLHMALNTTVIRALGQSFRSGKLASALFVAGQTLLTKIRSLFLPRRNVMGVVARRAPKPALAFAETATLPHLFHLTDETCLFSIHPAVDREEFDQGKAWPIIEHAAAETLDPVVPLKMALLANSRPKRWLEMPRIDDRQVPPIDRLLVLLVQFAGAVAPLATNRVAAEDWRFILVHRVSDRFDKVAMTE